MCRCELIPFTFGCKPFDEDLCFKTTLPGRH